MFLYNLVFFILSAENSFETLPRHNRAALLQNHLFYICIFQHGYQTYNYSSHYNTSLKFLMLLIKFIEYSSSADIVSSKPSVGSLPRIKITFFLLCAQMSSCTKCYYVFTKPIPSDNIVQTNIDTL